ncbi:MAG TPA: hypothetical protein VN783_15110 [Thermoanaerobaculia bacterium]|nr:hypothetical protein [Thermoanaerobaculia bacterium]
MRKLTIPTLALLAMALLTIPAQAAGTQAKPMAMSPDAQSWVGWITDNCDGVHGARPDNTKAKVQRCKEAGGRVVLYNLATKSFYDLDKLDLALDNVGRQVTVTGTLDGRTIKVESIVPTPS